MLTWGSRKGGKGLLSSELDGMLGVPRGISTGLVPSDALDLTIPVGELQPPVGGDAVRITPVINEKLIPLPRIILAEDVRARSEHVTVAPDHVTVLDSEDLISGGLTVHLHEGPSFEGCPVEEASVLLDFRLGLAGDLDAGRAAREDEFYAIGGRPCGRAVVRGGVVGIAVVDVVVAGVVAAVVGIGDPVLGGVLAAGAENGEIQCEDEHADAHGILLYFVGFSQGTCHPPMRASDTRFETWL